jgi:hypothetical protein
MYKNLSATVIENDGAYFAHHVSQDFLQFIDTPARTEPNQPVAFEGSYLIFMPVYVQKETSEGESHLYYWKNRFRRREFQPNDLRIQINYLPASGWWALKQQLESILYERVNDMGILNHENMQEEWQLAIYFMVTKNYIVRPKIHNLAYNKTISSQKRRKQSTKKTKRKNRSRRKQSTKKTKRKNRSSRRTRTRRKSSRA